MQELQPLQAPYGFLQFILKCSLIIPSLLVLVIRSLWVGMVITLAISLLPLWHVYKMKLGSLMVLITSLFNLSVLLLIFNYNWHYYAIFLFLLFFSGIVFFLYLKTAKLVPIYLQTIFSILLVAFFWFRRLVMRDSGDLVSPYIIISSFFYIIIYLSGLIIDLSKRKAVFELMKCILMLVNTFFYWGSVMYVLQKYGYQNLQGPFTLILALFNGTLFYFLPKFNSEFTRSLYVFLILFFISMIFPLIINQNYLILFSSLFSILLIFYATFAKNGMALSGSIGMLTIMLITLIFKCTFLYFPGLFEGSLPLKQDLFADGLLTGIYTTAAIFFNYRMIKNQELLFPFRRFSRRRYRRILKIVLILTLYLSAFWCWNFMFTRVFPIEEARLVSWFSFTCLFMIILVPILSKQRSSLLRPVFWLAGLTLLAYPLIVNPEIIQIRNKSLRFGNGYTSCYLAHYLILILVLALMACLYYYLMKIRKKKRILVHAFQALIIGFALCLVLIEYDHFTVFFGYNGRVIVSEMISRNHLLPYSIIVLIAALLLTIFSVIRKHRFIRQVSFLLFTAALVKIFAIDFAFLGDNYKVVVLFILSVFLMFFSYFYQRFRKAVEGRKKVDERTSGQADEKSHRVTK